MFLKQYSKGSVNCFLSPPWAQKDNWVEFFKSWHQNTWRFYIVSDGMISTARWIWKKISRWIPIIKLFSWIFEVSSTGGTCEQKLPQLWKQQLYWLFQIDGITSTITLLYSFSLVSYLNSLVLFLYYFKWLVRCPESGPESQRFFMGWFHLRGIQPLFWSRNKWTSCLRGSCNLWASKVDFPNCTKCQCIDWCTSGLHFSWLMKIDDFDLSLKKAVKHEKL